MAADQRESHIALGTDALIYHPGRAHADGRGDRAQPVDVILEDDQAAGATSEARKWWSCGSVLVLLTKVVKRGENHAFSRTIWCAVWMLLPLPNSESETRQHAAPPDPDS